MNAQIDLGEMYIAVSPYKGKNPALLVNFKGETEIYKVATFKDKATADWFVECCQEAFQKWREVHAKRGEWVEQKEKETRYLDRFTQKYWKCSECGIEITNTVEICSVSNWKYCPNCGADMRQKEENDGT